MSIDTPARRLDWKGVVLSGEEDEATVSVTGDDGLTCATVVHSAEVAANITRLAEAWPLGSVVEWMQGGAPSGIHGTVAPDEPSHTPGVHTGKPGAWTLTATGELVHVRWGVDNRDGTGLSRTCPHLMWMRVEQLRLRERGRS